MRTSIAMLTLSALSACTSFGSLPGPVNLAAADVPAVASAIVQIIGRRMPPGQSPLRLDTPPDEMGQAVAARVIQDLKVRGYVIEETSRSARQTGFAVTPLKAGLLLSVTIDGGAAAALLSRDASGALVWASGLSYREAAQ
jgi:hypothetical protein